MLTRDQLLDEIWGYEYYGETRTVDVHIRYLRKKIEDDQGKIHRNRARRGLPPGGKTWEVINEKTHHHCLFNPDRAGHCLFQAFSPM